MSAHVSLGLAGSLGPDVISRLAAAAERGGFHALWVNDTPDGNALAALAAAAETTERLVLATGVIPVDRCSADEIADQAEGLPQERLVLGVGSGAAKAGALARVREAIEQLRERSSARVVVGALGPRMQRLGAEHADGVLLNWVPPRAAARQAAELHRTRPGTHVALYVRTAVTNAAADRVRREAERYGSYPQYAANFERLGVRAIETTMPDAPSFSMLLPAYASAVDEVVLRAVTAEDDVGSYLDFIQRTAPAAL